MKEVRTMRFKELLVTDKQKTFQIGSTLVLFLGAYLPFFGATAKFWLYLLAYLIIGFPVIKEALVHLFQGKWFDENFLMTIATLGAFGVKQYPEAVAVMLFYAIGDLFEEVAVARSKRSITDLLDIRPEYAQIKMATGELKRVTPKEVEVGATIVVKTGEKIPLDGIVTNGSSYVDTAALTGESEPRAVLSGSEVLSGMIVKNGVLEIKVTKEYGASTIAKILELVENASQKKAPTEKFITRFAKIYTPVVVCLAVLLATIAPLFFGRPFEPWFYRALIFLVISCPCALVISIPLGFFAGIGAASRQGVLVKGSDYLERLTKIKTFVFDKTGTLTTGEFKVAQVVPAEKVTPEELVRLAAIAEQHSPHPLARSIVSKNGQSQLPAVEALDEQVGAGVKATYLGKELLVGNAKLLKAHGFQPLVSDVKTVGSIVHVAYAGQVKGYLVITDTLKKTAKKTIAQLKAKELTPVMLTGDRQKSAQSVAKELGIAQFKAELLPQDKLVAVQKLQQKNGHHVAFVGDGLNDTPVLSQADVGIAMGALGSDAAVEAADVVLMKDDPQAILKALTVAKRTQKIVWQNIILALGIKTLFLILGAFGDVTMWEAVFADVGVTVLAVLNALRIMYPLKK